MEFLKNVSLMLTLLFFAEFTVYSQKNWRSTFYKMEEEMIKNEKLSTKEIKQLHRDGTIPYYYLQDISYYILPKKKNLAERYLIECAEYGMIDTSRLNQSSLSIKAKENIRNSYFNKVDQYYIGLLKDVSGRLAVEQHYRMKWMKSRFSDSLALYEMKKQDSLNFDFIDGIIKEKRITTRGEFGISYAPMFLHVTSERFANDSIGFENYRQDILEMVKTNDFPAGLYAVWVDRYYAWHLKSEKQVFGVFRDVNLPYNQLPEVIDIEVANQLRSEIGLRTIEKELEFRKLKSN